MTWHRLSNKRPNDMIADCSVCGPNVRAVRKSRGRLGCRAVVCPSSQGPIRKLRARSWRLKAYNLTLSDYDALLAVQGGRCAACRTDQPGGNGAFPVDHDHVTGKVRGLLCNECNVILGKMGDCRENARIRGLLAYAARHDPSSVFLAGISAALL